jgi:hypothetical protein
VLQLDRARAASSGDVRARSAVAWSALLLLLLYGVTAALLDPRGGLGTDTGGKVATLESMVQRGDWSVDVGYWAAALDPDGVHHPLWGTVPTERGDWVQVTTVPMLLAARPLYDAGGTAAAWLVPALGGVAAALAAAALARRFGGGDRAALTAFWSVGAASPVLLYATDVWEHTWGLALMAWAVVLLAGPTDRPPSTRAALGAGVLFGAAVTMRTEALVFFAATVLVLAAARGPRVRERAALVGGLTLGFAAVALAYSRLEGWFLGETLRTSRTATTFSGSGAGLGVRAREAAATLLSLDGDALPGIVLGALFVGAVGAAVVFAVRGASDRARLAAVLAAVVLLLRGVGGPGFVPGLLAAAPVAVAGVVLARSVPAARRFVLALAVAVPTVWATQLTGGAAPQWGGRYLLLAGLVLTVVGVVSLEHRPRVLAGVVGAAVAVTLFGTAWHTVRTHGVGEAFATIAERPEPVAVFTEPFLPREAGAAAVGERWLTAGDAATFERAVEVVALAGFDELLLVTFADESDAWPAPDGWQVAGDAERLDLLPGLDLELRTLVRVAS